MLLAPIDVVAPRDIFDEPGISNHCKVTCQRRNRSCVRLLQTYSQGAQPAGASIFSAHVEESLDLCVVSLSGKF